MRRSFCLVLIVMTFWSCKDDLECGDPADTFAVIKLVDSDTNESLVCPDCLYHPDTIAALDSQRRLETVDSLIVIGIYTFADENSLLLRLSSTETDTIQLLKDRKEFDCYDLPVLTSMTYNGNLVFQGELVGSNNEIIEVQK